MGTSRTRKNTRATRRKLSRSNRTRPAGRTTRTKAVCLTLYGALAVADVIEQALPGGHPMAVVVARHIRAPIREAIELLGGVL
jgi:hypothetical protein